MMLESKKILTTNKGISLISLIITIIVIIILAAIVIFSGLGTPDSANLAKFTSEFADFNLAVDNAYMKEVEKNALANESRSKKQVYYEIATGIDVVETNAGNVNQVPTATGTVSALEAQVGKIYPETIEGEEYYTITSDTNVYNWKNQKQYFEESEVHYLTDEGEAFFLPGYLVQEDDGSQKWFINESKYYYGEKQNGAGGVVTPPPQGGDEPQIELNENSAANLLEVGDYVNYVPDSKSYNLNPDIMGASNGEKTTAVKNWRVLSINKVTGEVLITTDENAGGVLIKRTLNINNEIVSEVDKMIKELYSNEVLGLTGKRLTEDDINKAFGYIPQYEVYRTAYYDEDEEIEEGSIVIYKGEEYKVDKSDHIFYMTASGKNKIEGGEETIGLDGLTGITAVKGNPIYATYHGYSYNKAEYNSKLTEMMNFDGLFTANKEFWYSTTDYVDVNGYRRYMMGYFNMFFDDGERISLKDGVISSTYQYFPFNLCYFYPAVVLNANTLIDTSDSTRDGKSAEKAWNFKY